MKKMVYRLFALALACMLFASMSLMVSAAELDLTTDTMPIALENGPDAGYVSGARISGLPFTLTAANVTSFLSSSVSSKGFVPSSYSGHTIYVTGKLTHSVSGGGIRSGICYYNASQGVYVPGVYRDTTSGGNISMSVYAGNLVQGATYFGYIRNNASSGAVNGGSITVYAN